MSSHIQFKASTKLDSLEVKTLLTEGAELFSLLQLTPDAKAYLRFHPKLAEVIDKW
jgi:hypothetical protein